MAYFTSIAEARRREIERTGAASTQDQTTSGKTLIKGVGKGFFHVDFPVVFAGEPVPSFGAVLDPRNPFATLTATFECSALVAGFDLFGAVAGAFDGYFTGADIAWTIRGAQEQFTWVTWSFHGPALRNPIDAGDPEIL